MFEDATPTPSYNLLKNAVIVKKVIIIIIN